MSIRSMPRRTTFGPRSRYLAGSQRSNTCAGSTTWSSTLMIFGRSIRLAPCMSLSRPPRHPREADAFDRTCAPMSAGFRLPVLDGAPLRTGTGNVGEMVRVVGIGVSTVGSRRAVDLRLDGEAALVTGGGRG